MNLRLFHALLIFCPPPSRCCSVSGVWAVYGREDGLANLLAGVVSFAVSFGLVVYDSWFLRKTRTLR